MHLLFLHDHPVFLWNQPLRPIIAQRVGCVSCTMCANVCCGVVSCDVCVWVSVCGCRFGASGEWVRGEYQMAFNKTAGGERCLLRQTRLHQKKKPTTPKRSLRGA